ncbi:MAG TPA: hypothetical protein VK826_15825 [Bacteroidia bacterium]|nr:hypothetical protein [Bacteroidia bacterium]
MDDQKNNEKQNNRKLHFLYLAIIFLLGGLCVYLATQYSGLKTIVAEREITITQVIQEREDVKSDLEDLKAQYAELQTTDATLSAELEAKKAYIDSLLVEADKHKGDAFIIAKLKKETQTLRAIMKGYIVTIDSLNTLNNTLRAEKQEVLTALDEEKGKVTRVTDEKSQLQGRIDKAALLTTLNARASGVNVSRNGKKESETNKASKTDKLKISFDVADNDLTKSGAHTVYLRVMTPDGKELTQSEDPDHQFSWNGNNRGYFASKKTIDYQNQSMSVLMYCNKAKEEDEFLPGLYRIEIVCDGAIIGETTMTLQ